MFYRVTSFKVFSSPIYSTVPFRQVLNIFVQMTSLLIQLELGLMKKHKQLSSPSVEDFQSEAKIKEGIFVGPQI